MNTLRKLEAGWRKQSKTDWIDQGSRVAHGICADELSSAIPAWERLEKAVENSLRARGGGRKDCGHDFECICPDDELREALEGVKAK